MRSFEQVHTSYDLEQEAGVKRSKTFGVIISPSSADLFAFGDVLFSHKMVWDEIYKS